MNELITSDPVLVNDWHPVAKVSDLKASELKSVVLLDCNIVIWRDSLGAIYAWEDRCPHRGMKLSMGVVSKDEQGHEHLSCPYHGWQYGKTGKCQFIPALPHLKAENLKATVKPFLVQEQYGLIWVCLGEPDQGVAKFPEYNYEYLRKVVCGPYEVKSSGPRIIENFLDMAHFGFIHDDILGDKNHTAIKNYYVETFDDDSFGNGIWAKKCYAWQPQPNKAATIGGDVEYSYRVVRPLTAILTKEPQEQDGFSEAISLHLQPVSETLTQAWIILAMTDFDHSDEELRDFQTTIFMQDKPIVENQQPLKLPLWQNLETSIACDKMSLAYRKYLKDLDLHYGTV